VLKAAIKAAYKELKSTRPSPEGEGSQLRRIAA